MNRVDLDAAGLRRMSPAKAVWAVLLRQAQAFALAAAVFVAAYVSYAFLGLHEAAATAGVERGLPVNAPVAVLRDDRDVPHVRAHSLHDLFFAQGYAAASDRLDQMELMRRFIDGRLAEILGPKQLWLDEEMRYYDARDVVERQWAHLPQRDRSILQAYSDGVNAAIARQPLPFEFRTLIYVPERWTPLDSLATALAVSTTLEDSWHNVFARNEVWRRDGRQAYEAAYPLSDPRYDVTLDGRFANSRLRASPREAVARGSNAWAAGSARTIGGRALVANDPHLDLDIPGLWYLVDLEAPGFHAAGASIPGIPGVILGHNERIAWATTNAATTTFSIYDAGELQAAGWQTETFHVRFGKDVRKRYYRTPSEFGVPYDFDGTRMTLVRWSEYASNASSIPAILVLDGAKDARGALAAVAHYSGAAQNFIVADRNGSVAYHVIGSIPADGAWGRFVHPAADLRIPLRVVPFAELPHADPNAANVVLSANNKMYAGDPALRLSAAFVAPYRAYRIAQLLHERARYDEAYFARMQLDDRSPMEAEFARAVAAYARQTNRLPPNALQLLASWDGRFSQDSRAATEVHALRASLDEENIAIGEVVDCIRTNQCSQRVQDGLDRALSSLRFDALAPWRVAGATTIAHPFGPYGFAYLNGATLPGDGDDYTVHMQTPGIAQSFRAVWDVGNWDAGGIVVPSGESGEPASPHYRDLTPTWQSGTLVPLPFSSRAVTTKTQTQLHLLP